ncbi:hypothetical protein M878_06830 [Streptomyces roseochromogenus subsp. oscitans DS 12.976]|uniref:Uncharacterized protein n=1 Tax=Streptomyces roseochromogenus subsp. oscitans DS 12.976 TaxID=1352936 RepID=V6KSV4_STRRC|nr:hypothetical protein M878_06830 [Streptomyces roseochromogenus subsp. oscitans DS 12.976]
MTLLVVASLMGPAAKEPLDFTDPELTRACTGMSAC